uniref:Replicative DNA helicase n=1 Tax=Mastocarpus papillatus TaxID=31436 RepID=A0A342RZD7_9FLOR|nr:putative replicative DNA helicase [Mastocarpus papillatus]AOL58083.1 putative replicative DNA helicase [Mastocarpus papillatus]
MHNVQYNLLPPQNYIAEEIILGSIIVKPDLFDLIVQYLQIECFFLECHRIIYRNLIEINKSKKIDSINLIYSLQENKMLHFIGGTNKIIEIIKQSQVFTYSINTNFYLNELIKIIHENYTKRLIVQYGYNIIQLAYNKKISNQKLYFKSSQYINYIKNKTTLKNLDSLKELVSNLITNIQHQEHDTKYLSPTIYSGFEELDKLICGLSNGDLVVIAARPSMGKTSFVINIAYNILQNTNTRICIFSLEMTRVQILYKLIAIGSTIPIKEILSGHINVNEWQLIQHICNHLLKSRIYINDTANISIDEIIYIAKFIAKEKEYKQIIIIDYLQLIQTKNLNIESRTQELSYVTRQLKILAQTLKVPVVILSQLNRNVETRIDKRPLLSDLKESGCIDYTISNHINYTNQLNIKNIIKYQSTIDHQYIKFKSSLKIECISSFNPNFTNKIYVLNQYIFKCTIYYKKQLLITNNHKIFIYKQWILHSQVNKNNTVINYINKYYNILQITRIFLKNILFTKYNLVYDVEKENYTHYICNQIILHNSIEQDADIVIMLYSCQSNSEYNTSSKILDINVAKNRNGSIGYFQLVFHTQNTLFTNVNTISNNIVV